MLLLGKNQRLGEDSATGPPPLPPPLPIKKLKDVAAKANTAIATAPTPTETPLLDVLMQEPIGASYVTKRKREESASIDLRVSKTAKKSSKQSKLLSRHLQL